MTIMAAEARVLVVTERNPWVAVSDELARGGGVQLVGRLDGVRAGLHAAREHRADALVVEVATPERLKELAASPAALVAAKVIAVSALPAEAALLTLLAAGVRGFVRRPFPPGMVQRALAEVRAGHTFVDPTSTQWLVELALHGHRTRPDGLTLRQSQVVELVRGGFTNREIARVLDLSLATVKSHLHAAMRRLGVTDRWAAAVLADQLREDRQ